MSKCIAPIKIQGYTFDCRKCIPCAIRRRNSWSFRLEEEHRHAETASFLTFTYDNEHLVYHLEKKEPTLVREHMTTLTRTIRKTNERDWKDIKHKRAKLFVCGEYGTKFKRPHYHMIAYNLHNNTIDRMVNQSVWNKGMIHVGTVTPASIAYVSKYVLDLNGAMPSPWVQRPFITSSKGIGESYLTPQMIAYHKMDDDPANWRPFAQRNGVKRALPKYYKDKIWTEDGERLLLGEMLFEFGEQKLREDLEKISREKNIDDEKALAVYLDRLENFYLNKLTKSLTCNTL